MGATQHSRSRGWRTLRWLSLIGITALIVVAAINMRSPQATTAQGADTTGREWTVRRGDLTISLLAPGTVQASRSTSIASAVQGDAKIVYLIPEGTIVQKGDKLVELEAGQLEERVVNQRIGLSTQRAAYNQAVENFEIQKLENTSNLLSAGNAKTLAELELKKYLEGDFPQLLLEKQAEIKIAEAQLERAEDRANWTGKLVEKGYVSAGEEKADQLSLTQMQLDLEKARNSLVLLEEFERQHRLLQLENAVREAQEHMVQVELNNSSLLRNKETAMNSEEAKLKLEELRLKDLEEQLAGTVILAPEPGMVVFASQGRRNEEKLVEGDTVYFRQKLIDLPDFSNWEVEARVHESLIKRVEPGLPAVISIDALPGETVHAKVDRISVLPQEARWFQPDVKEYTVVLDMTTTTLSLKPGMTTKAELLLDRLDDVLHVPLQAVYSRGEKQYVMRKGETGPREQEVEVGQHNDRFIAVASGLSEGDVVLLGEGSQEQPILKRPAQDANLDSKGRKEQVAPAITVGDATAPSSDASEPLQAAAASTEAESPATVSEPVNETAAVVEQAVAPATEAEKPEATQEAGNTSADGLAVEQAAETKVEVAI